jgi:hypothetical protein
MASRTENITAYTESSAIEFPGAVPEIPVSDLKKAAAYYECNLGFSIDWGDETGGIIGISKGNCRMFLTDDAFRKQYGNAGSGVAVAQSRQQGTSQRAIRTLGRQPGKDCFSTRVKAMGLA